MTLLEVTGLKAGYGGGIVLRGVDLAVDAGEGVTILGRNGAGKTTLVNTLMGLVRASAGTIRVAGESLEARRAHHAARAGLSIVPQGRRVFGPLTVRESLELSRWLCRRPGPWSQERILELLPRLGERLDHRAEQLSGGEQQMLALARALLANPVLLLLDEPSDGLAPAVVREISNVLVDVRASGVGLIVIEQDLRLAFYVADEVRVMDKGRFVHAATVDEFRRDRDTARRLLGIGPA